MQILANGKNQWIDQNGAPLVNGSVYFYAPGTTNPLTTYQDQGGTIANTNPIQLDSRGQAIVWGSGTFRQIVKDASGVTIWDQVVTSASSAADLAASGATPGASLIGWDGGTVAQMFTGKLNRVVDSIALLRALGKTVYTRAFVTGYYAAGDGGGGSYWYDPNDTSSADNGGSVIVASDGGRWKLQFQSFVTLRQFGARMNYTNGSGTDDSAALANALAAMAAKGGKVIMNSDGVAYIASSQSVPAGVTLEGPYLTPDSTLTMASNPISILGLGGAIALNSAATITLGGAASVNGLLMYRSGITLPATDGTAFAGTAITIGGPGASVRNSLLIGFNQLVYSNGFERVKIEYLYGDGQNGIEITAANDVPRLTHVHLWPFATYTPTASLSAHYRSGNGIYIHDSVDGVSLLDVFVYSYLNCFYFKNISTIRMVSCMADGSNSQANSVGLRLEGNINGLLGTCNAMWSRATGVYVNMNVGQFVDLIDIKFDTIAGAGIDLVGGGVDVSDCLFGNMANCLKIENINVEAFFDKNQYTNISGDPVAAVAAGTVNVVVGDKNFNLDNTVGAALNSSNLAWNGINSASTLSLSPNFHNYFIIGTTTINAISTGWKDRIVRFRFTGVTTVNNVPGVIRLSGGVNFTSAVGSILSLIHDGTQWYEIGRSA